MGGPVGAPKGLETSSSRKAILSLGTHSGLRINYSLRDTGPVVALPNPQFNAAARSHLEALGFSKRGGDLYTLPVSQDFLGFVGLGRATKHGELRIWPTVGVRHQPTERVLAELLESSFHAYAPPTVVSGIGYLMPEGRWLDWAVEDAEEANLRAAEIAEAVREYGFPAIQRHATVLALIDDLTSSSAEMTSPRDSYLRPVLLAELGRRDDADAEVALGLAARRSRTDAEAERHRRFATRFADWQADSQ